jgi:anti-sigma factor ChrR (cupin superfamily)
MKSFGKHPGCPTSHDIFSYAEGGLRPLARQRIAQHCAVCDFCGAEAQFFAKFRPAEEGLAPAPTPALITVLGVRLPRRKTYAVQEQRAA